MEKKKRYKKTAASTPQEANGTTEPLINEDQNSPNVANEMTIAASSHDNTTESEQFQPSVRWPYTSQPANEQSPFTTNPSSTILGQGHQSQNQQQSSSTYKVQQNLPWPQFSQLAMPLLLAQQPGYHLSGVGLPAPYQHFPPAGTTDVTWRVPGVANGGIMRSQQHSPSFYYHVGYPYPGFPGPWDPSFWFIQLQNMLPSCTSTSVEPCSQFPTPLPPMPRCSLTSAASDQQGIIRPSVKLSLKHQQLWEAQSLENVQLWKAVGELQSELADCKCRMTKLESDVLALEPVVKQATARRSGGSLRGQTSKRGRPKKMVTSNNALSSDPSPPRVCAWKPAPGNAEYETKGLLKQVDDGASIQQADDGNGESNDPMNCSGSIKFPNSCALVHDTRNHSCFPGAKTNETSLKNSSELITKHGKDAASPGFTVSSHLADRLGTLCSSRNYAGLTSDGNLLWPSSITSEECGRELMDITGYNDVTATGQGRQAIVGWNFGNRVDGLVGVQNVIEELAKEEDQEMEDERSSGAMDMD